MKKKETTLSVLKEIRDILINGKPVGDVVKERIEKPVDESAYFKITFPSKTAKEIVDECENKLESGKLLYDREGWKKDEDFFTKEKTRPRTVYVHKEIIGFGKTHSECVELIKKEGGEMLNMAEMIFVYQEYFKATGKYLDENNWSWTSSRSSGGGLVIVGGCDAGGVGVGIGYPGGSSSRLGVRFFRSAP